MSEGDMVNGGADDGDDYGQFVHNIPDSDVIETPGNTTGGGTTSVPDALPDVPGNNPSINSGLTGSRIVEGPVDLPEGDP